MKPFQDAFAYKRNKAERVLCNRAPKLYLKC